MKRRFTVDMISGIITNKLLDTALSNLLEKNRNKFNLNRYMKYNRKDEVLERIVAKDT